MSTSTSTVVFRVSHTPVGVQIDEPAIADGVRRLYTPYEVTLDPPPARLLGIGQTEAGWLITGSAHAPALAFDTVEGVVSAFEYVLTLELLETCNDRPQLHAAGVVVNGKALLALGPSGSGKSTLALAWSTGGLPVLGDDIVLLGEDGRAVPFKRLFAVSPERLNERGCVPDPWLMSLGDEEDGWYDPASGGGWAAPAPVALVAVLRYEAGAPAQVRDISRVDLLAELVAGLMSSGRGRAECFDALTDLVLAARVVELAHGGGASAARALVELM